MSVIILSVFQLSLINAIPMMQLSIPGMMGPRAIRQHSHTKRVHSGLFTDASPVFKFLSEAGNSYSVSQPEIRVVDMDNNSVRYNFLNNYLGYNTLNI